MFRTVSLQCLLAIPVALLVGVFAHLSAGTDVLLGAAACIVPNLLFARLLQRLRQLPPQAFVMAFFLGEAFKLALTLLALLAIVKWQSQAQLGLVLLGMIVALLAPLLGFFCQQKDSPEGERASQMRHLATPGQTDS